MQKKGKLRQHQEGKKKKATNHVQFRFSSVQFRSGPGTHGSYGELGGGDEGGEEAIGTLAGICARVCTWDSASDIACPSVIVHVVVEPPLVVSSASDRPSPPPPAPARTDGDGDGDGGCGEPRPRPCRPLSSDNEAELRPAARAPCLLADIARDIAAATAAVAAASDDDTEIDDRPGSLLSSVCARAPARRQRRESRTYGSRGYSVRPRSRPTCRPGARRPRQGATRAVSHGLEQARCSTSMRCQCPESGYVRARVQAQATRSIQTRASCAASSRYPSLSLSPSWYSASENVAGRRR